MLENMSRRLLKALWLIWQRLRYQRITANDCPLNANPNTIYDIFADGSRIAWKSGTERAEHLHFDWLERPCSANGALYLGSLITNSRGVVAEDNDEHQYVWNYYQREMRIRTFDENGKETIR